MMRSLQKITSIIIVFSILMAVFVVAFGSVGVSAYTVNGTATEEVRTFSYNFKNDSTGASDYATTDNGASLVVNKLCFTPDSLTEGTGGYDISLRQQKVEAGKKYYVSMDVKVTDTNTVINNLRTYTASEAVSVSSLTKRP